MAELVTDGVPENTSNAQVSAVDGLASSLATVVVHDASQPEPAIQHHEKDTAAFCPIKTYTRRQLLLLHSSPLVQVPPNMPALKDWFGTDNEQSLSKKDLEPIAPAAARDRRSRRDAEESPMGNFKHQRPNDDRGLRHLPEKFVPPTQRETAPHLNTSPSNRTGTQSQVSATVSRRADVREAAKKKGGEASDDWRRGAEPRSAREDRAEPSRRDRDERERPRSRMRDSSRNRGDPSVPRRDRDRDRDREDKDRVRGEREREDSRRDRDEIRRERDADREVEVDDPRRWRDDGKRDERMAARRGDRYSEQYRDRERGRDKEWDPTSERRWVPVEERDGRPKRITGREKRNGPNTDDTKEREDRRDRDREREREKEPAWMDTYIPSPSSGNLLGGQGADGELDGIQAWKKSMKEKELKATVTESNGAESCQPPIPNGQLDEIQLFRLLMKREEEKKKLDNADALTPLLGTQSTALNVVQGRLVPKTSEDDLPQVNVTPAVHGMGEQSSHPDSKLSPRPLPEVMPPSVRRTPHPTPDYKRSTDSTPNSSSSLEPSAAGQKAPLSSSVIPSRASQETNGPDTERTPSVLPPQFNPPQGSRLLAFARASSASARPQATLGNTLPNGTFQTTGAPMIEPNLQQGLSKTDTVRPLQGFSPFEDQTRTAFTSEEPGNFGDPSTAHHQELREHIPFTPSTEHSSFHDSASDNGVGFSAAKGSRFAKFFDGKGREGAIPAAKPQGPLGFASSSPGPGPGQRQEHYNGALGDHRAMDDIYAMLNSSSQNQRGGNGNIPSTAPLSHTPFGQQAQAQHIFQQQPVFHQNPQQIHGNRLEPLYESRLDDRNFMPDGMVPGLRSAPPRSRENAGYPDVLDDSLHLNHHHQRLPQQHRAVDQMYSGSMYSQHTGRNNAFPLQQPHYRGGASPISNQPASLQNPQQRLPPGLANLGGRPPLEPSQYLGMPGIPAPGLHGGLHLNGSGQPPFNAFTAGSNMNYVGGPQGRGPHQLPNPVVHQAMGGPGHQSHMDLRSGTSSQALGMSGVGLGGIRSVGNSFPGHHGPPSQGQGPLLAMRPQQQQQQLPPHLMPHLLPPHLQQQAPPGPNGSQPTHDLMALLMGGTHRE